MATQKEIKTLWTLLETVIQDIEQRDEFDAPVFESHPLQEQGTYADGVSDCIKLLLKCKTLKETLNQ